MEQQQRLGVRLFNRTTRSVSLTEVGEQFLSQVQPALHDISAAMDAVNEFRDTPNGTLCLITSEGAAKIVMKPIVLESSKRYPAIRVDVVTDSRLVAMV